jgi:hypothetical protein
MLSTTEFICCAGIQGRLFSGDGPDHGRTAGSRMTDVNLEVAVTSFLLMVFPHYCTNMRCHILDNIFT